MKTPPFLMTEIEKERILAAHREIITEDTIPYPNLNEICMECLTDSIPTAAINSKNKIFKGIDDYMSKGKKPTLDDIKDILWDLAVLKNPMLILTVGKDIYACMTDGDC
tara:strand:+ start:451 stop:777 length:327 start_codon:yes stop_codon:yes gene_type:complete